MLTRSLPSGLLLKSNGCVHTTRTLMGGGLILNVGWHAPSLAISAFTAVSLGTDCPFSTTAVSSSTNGNLGTKEDENRNAAVFTVQLLGLVILVLETVSPSRIVGNPELTWIDLDEFTENANSRTIDPCSHRSSWLSHLCTGLFFSVGGRVRAGARGRGRFWIGRVRGRGA